MGSTATKRMCVDCQKMQVVDGVTFGVHLPYYCTKCRHAEAKFSPAAKQWVFYEKKKG